jgi:hypothetical protein
MAVSHVLLQLVLVPLGLNLASLVEDINAAEHLGFIIVAISAQIILIIFFSLIILFLPIFIRTFYHYL